MDVNTTIQHILDQVEHERSAGGESAREGVRIVRADVSNIADIHALEIECFAKPWPLEMLYEDIAINQNLYFVAK